ncbi:MAG: 1-deoxy-D-xylulose-5-phosphate reductoisomerase [Pseudomonadota bacterium]
MSDPDVVSILGSTGSIGVNTLDVIRRHRHRFLVEGLCAHRNIDLLAQQIQEFGPRSVVISDSAAAREFHRTYPDIAAKTSVHNGAEAISEMAAGDAQTIVCGIVGAAGLPSTLAAVEAGKRVLLANKEPLVMMGQSILSAARRSGATLLPVDSEHNAVFQCLPRNTSVNNAGSPLPYHTEGIRRIILTGSGGPFRTRDASTFGDITPDEACTHPNWDMGQKISVDSATMMNKGLEIIEACVLFDVPEAKIDVIIHPQSAVHSMVEYDDGSVLAQMASPDMRVPIANALSWPQRIESGAKWIDFLTTSRLDFEAPQEDRFPALSIARQCARQGGSAPVILNASNEVAVNAFLDRQITFDQITTVVEKVLDQAPILPCETLDQVLAADQHARALASSSMVCAEC